MLNFPFISLFPILNFSIKKIIKIYGTDTDHLTSNLNWEKSPQAPTVHGSLMNVTAKNVDYKAPIIQECIHEMLPAIGPYDKRWCPRVSMHWWPLAKKMNTRHLSKGEFS